MIWHTMLRSDVLATISQTMDDSPIDQTIAKWMNRVQQASQDGQAWTQLGDALMQKASETADTSYYGHAEAVFHTALSLEPQSVAELSDRPAAQQHLYRALSLNPSFHPVYAPVAADMLKQLGRGRAEGYNR